MKMNKILEYCIMAIVIIIYVISRILAIMLFPIYLFMEMVWEHLTVLRGSFGDMMVKIVGEETMDEFGPRNEDC